MDDAKKLHQKSILLHIPSKSAIFIQNSIKMIARKELPTYTYADYASWKGDWELIEGIPYAMSSSKGIHQYIAMQLSGQIWNELSNCPKCNVYADLDWIISDTTVFRPDLFIFCGHRIDEYLRESPNLIIEILSKKTA